MDEASASGKLFIATSRLRGMRLSHTLKIMHKGEFIILDILSKCEATEKLNISDIAKKLEISTPAVSKAITKLEDKGFVCRITDKKDRRNTYLAITKEGRERHEIDAAKMDEFLNNVFSHFSREEFDDLLFLIDKMAKSAEEELKKMYDGGES